MSPSCTTTWPLSNKLLKKYDVAEGYYVLALAMREDTLGSNYPDVAASFNRSAVLYHTQKQYFAAELIYNLELKIYLSMLGDDELGAASIFNSLGVLYQVQEEYEDDEYSLQRALPHGKRRSAQSIS